MNKLLSIILFFLPMLSGANIHQGNDSINYSDQVAKVPPFGYNIKLDTLNDKLVPINIDSIKIKKFNADFRSKYDSSEFNYNINKENGLIAKIREWWRNFIDWFSFDVNETTYIVDEILNIIIAIIAIIAVGYLIHYLNKKGFIKLFAPKDQQVINEKYIEENIESINFDLLITDAKQNQNYRKAVRYYYLSMLKSWSQNNLIEYLPNKTTKQYLNEIKDKNTALSFQYLSYIYENIWYGFHEISISEFTAIENQFLQLQNKE
jgi:hypothetical protein